MLLFRNGKNIPIKSNFDNRSTNKQKLLSYDHMNTANLYHTNTNTKDISSFVYSYPQSYYHIIYLTLPHYLFNITLLSFNITLLSFLFKSLFPSLYFVSSIYLQFLSILLYRFLIFSFLANNICCIVLFSFLHQFALLRVNDVREVMRT